MIRVVLAALQGAVSAPQQETTVQTVWEFLSSGGPIMIPIALCSIFAVAFALERWGRLKPHRVVPDRVQEVVAMLDSGRVDEASRLAEEIDAPAARILAAGLRRRGFTLRDVEGAMEDQGHKEMERLRSNIRPLHLIAGVAPLLGLLGTVLGIQEAFHKVVRTGMGKPEHLASGIEEALVTTIAGLTVAIPTMLVAAHLTNKARRLILRCDELVSPVVERLAHRPEERDAA